MKITLENIEIFNITLNVRVDEKHLWKDFHNYHYMTAGKDPKTSFPNSAKFFTFYWVKDGVEILVGCLGVMFQIASYPAKRLTRVVVLPEFQGLGISSKMINGISDFYTRQGFKIYGATFHPRLGEFRENSDNWEAGHYNLRPFKLSDNHSDKTMSGLRDGEIMYRHYFKSTNKYELIYNPLVIDNLKKEIQTLEKDLNENTVNDYKELRKTLKEIYKINGTPMPDEKLLDIGSLTDDDNKKYKKSLKRNKRKVLSKEERLKLKEAHALKNDTKRK